MAAATAPPSRGQSACDGPQAACGAIPDTVIDDIASNDDFLNPTPPIPTVWQQTSALSVDPADFDGDGDLDVVSGGNGGTPLLVLYLEPYSTGWQVAYSENPDLTTAKTSACYDVAAGDFDGDGLPDIAIGRLINQPDYWLRNTGVPGQPPHTDHFLAPATFNPLALGPAGNKTFGVTLGDVDLDGDLDLLTSGADYGIRYYAWVGSDFQLQTIASQGNPNATEYVDPTTPNQFSYWRWAGRFRASRSSWWRERTRVWACRANRDPRGWMPGRSRRSYPPARWRASPVCWARTGSRRFRCPRPSGRCSTWSRSWSRGGTRCGRMW